MKKAKEKFLNKETFTDLEVGYLAGVEYSDDLDNNNFDEGIKFIETIYGKRGRYSRSVKEIYQVDDRFFGLDWQEGYNMLDNEIYAQEATEYIREEVTTFKYKAKEDEYGKSIYN